MSNFLDCFASEMNQTALIYTQGKVFALGKYTITYTLAKSVKCGFWTGSQAESLVADRFKTIIDGVVIIKPGLLEDFTISRDDKIEVNSVNYSVVNADDIMLQGEVLIVGVKEFS